MKFKLLVLLLAILTPILCSSQSCTGDIAVFLDQLTNDFVETGETQATTFQITSPFDFRILRIDCNNDVLACSGLSITANFGNGTSSTITSAGEQISFTVPGTTTITVEGLIPGLTTVNLSGGVCNNEEFLIYSVDQIEQNACDCANFLSANSINIGQTVSCGVKNPTEPYITNFTIDPDQTQMPYRAVVALLDGTERVLTNDAPSATIVNMNAIFITGIENGQRNLRSDGGLSAYCDRSFDVISVTSGVLPVAFLSFSGYKKNDYIVELEWKTSSESNNEKFIVEKSLNGLDWGGIGDLYPNSNQTYKFFDNDFSRNSYYRIKQVDYSGEEYYSDAIFVESGNRKRWDVSIFPNPSSEQISIRFINEEEQRTNQIDINIISMDGKEVIKITDYDWNEISVYNLIPGTYIVKLKSLNQTLMSKLIIK